MPRTRSGRRRLLSWFVGRVVFQPPVASLAEQTLRWWTGSTDGSLSSAAEVAVADRSNVLKLVFACAAASCILGCVCFVLIAYDVPGCLPDSGT